MYSLLITITTAQHSADLSVPAGIPVSELLPVLLDLCGPEPLSTTPTQWHLRLSDATVPLKANQSLLDAGVTDGAILVLEDVTQGAQVTQQKREEEEQAFTPQIVLPSEDTGWIGVDWESGGQ